MFYAVTNSNYETAQITNFRPMDDFEFNELKDTVKVLSMDIVKNIIKQRNKLSLVK